MITVEELHDRDLIKSYKIELVYRKILNECYEFIEIVYGIHNKNETVFCVPQVIMKNEDYDFSACLMYIIKELRAAGFYVRYLRPNMLYISWVNEKERKERLNNLKELFKEDMITRNLLGGGSDNKKKLKQKNKMKTIEYVT